ncbi:MAG: ASPIC/UnbV domain-containing protein, partial [Deltaproteobacteria bacterium]|nr:ASPIC/UnbV domain-containing protein [Deltaproteobacteria bacterium]
GAPGFDADNKTESRGPNTLYSRKGGNSQTAQFRLEGVDSNRDAIGARIAVKVSPREGRPVTFHYHVRSAEGFQSQNSRWQLVDLKGAERAEVAVRWPSGRRTQHEIRAGAREIFRERPAE